MKITIIGAEGPMHSQLRRNVEDIIHELGLECELDVIHSTEEIIEFEKKQILITPALIIGDKIVSQGHVWPKEHIKQFIEQNCSKPQTVGATQKTDKFSMWKGVPRDEIEWHPIIDTDKCTGCGMCVTSCGRKVFDYDKKEKISIVARPLHCMVGCSSCQVWCVFEAISFPNPKRVRDFIIEKGILKSVKEEMK